MEINKIDLVLLSVDDWECLYENGKAIQQGHSIDLVDFLESISGEIVQLTFNSYWIDAHDLDAYGARFPSKLEDCIEYKDQIENGNE